MAISQNKYVDITSRFPARVSAERTLGGLVFTKSEMNSVTDPDLAEIKRSYDAGELVSLDAGQVGSMFSAGSAEEEFATKYYGYAGPSGGVPSALKFARVMATNVPVYQKGAAYSADSYVEHVGSVFKVLEDVSASQNTCWEGASESFSSVPAFSTEGKSIPAGALFVESGSLYRATAEIAEDTDFDDVPKSSYEEVMDVAEFATGISYDAGDVVKITATAGSVTYYECSVYLAAADNVVWSGGVRDKFDPASGVDRVYESAKDALVRIDKSDNAFGSFTFLSSGTKTFSETEVKAAVAYNTGLSSRYLSSVAVKKDGMNARSMVNKKSGYAPDGTVGCAFAQSYDGLSAYMPMAIMAATDYDNGGEATCHMYKQFPGEVPTVFSDDDYTRLSSNFVNFYGQTQTNGKKINFYQRGFNTDGTDTAIYCNEVWFKSRCITRLMNMFMDRERVPANNEGLAMVAYEVGEVCGLATRNGSFMPKEVSGSSASIIRSIVSKAGESASLADEIEKAIANVGYYVWTYLYQDSGEYKIGYYVFYGTADSVRFVKGDDLLVK